MKYARQFGAVSALGLTLALGACVSPTGDEYTGGQAYRDMLGQSLYEDNLTRDSSMAEPWEIVDEEIDTPLSRGPRGGALPDTNATSDDSDDD